MVIEIRKWLPWDEGLDWTIKDTRVLSGVRNIHSRYIVLDGGYMGIHN